MKKLYFALPFLFFPAVYSETIWKIDSQEEWEKSMASSESFKLVEGMAESTGVEGVFLSEIKAFKEKRSASSIQIHQSPIWLNWNPIENIGTSSMADAPVLLSLGPDDYWMFAKYRSGATGKKGEGKAKSSPFTPEEVTLEGFDIPLMTTPVANEFEAPGAKQKALGGY